MKNEGDVKKAVKLLFTSHGIWYFMPVMSGFGVQGIPDFLGACNGKMFAVETKFGTNKPTAIQEFQIQRLRGARVPVWVVSDRNFEEFKIQFEEWINACR